MWHLLGVDCLVGTEGRIRPGCSRDRISILRRTKQSFCRPIQLHIHWVPWHALGLTEHNSITKKMPVRFLSFFSSFILHSLLFSFRQTVIYTTVFRFSRSVIPFPSYSSFPLVITAFLYPPFYLCTSSCSSCTVQPVVSPHALYSGGRTFNFKPTYWLY